MSRFICLCEGGLSTRQGEKRENVKCNDRETCAPGRCARAGKRKGLEKTIKKENETAGRREKEKEGKSRVETSSRFGTG